MTKKRFWILNVLTENSGIKDGDKLLSFDEVVDLLNELHEENEYYKSIFFDIVENALEDKNCRELYCKGILSLFDDANSLNEAKEMIRERLE